MPITTRTKKDQPRQKLFKNGPKSLTDAELLAIILHTGIRGLSALDIAKSLLISHGDLTSLIDRPIDITSQKGVGRAKQAKLHAAIELGKRYLAKPIHTGQKLNSSHLTKAFLLHRLGRQPNEIFACLFLNAHFCLLQYEELFHGTVNQAAVYPREIIRRGLQHNAVNVILAHNHPSGNTTPSTADKEVTHTIQQSLALMDMVLADHIIVTAHESFSFKEHHLLT